MKNNTFHNSDNKKWMFVPQAIIRVAYHFLLVLAFLFATKAVADDSGITLAWDPNPEADIAGYRVHYGTSSGSYSNTLDVGNTTIATLTNLTPGATYYIAVSAYNSVNMESTLSAEVFTTFEPVFADADNNGLPDNWEAAQGIAGLSNPALSGAMGDADGDGISNLLEYSLGLPPAIPQGESPTPLSVAVNPHDGKAYLMFTYSRRVYAPGISYEVQVSEDLVDWDSPSDDIEPIGSPVASGDGQTEIITVRIWPAIEDGAPKKMVRLMVWQSPLE